MKLNVPVSVDQAAYVRRVCSILLEQSENAPHDRWSRFLEEAFREGVGGVLYYHGCLGALPAVPESVVEKLTEEFQINTGRNLLLQRELDAVVGHLETLGARTLVIRGADFCTRLYPHPGMRPMNDIDIVVFEEDYNRAREALERAGFVCSKGYDFFFEKENVFIDLHLDKVGFWRAPGSPSMSIRDGAWHDALPFGPGRTHVRRLCPEDAFLSSCEHLQRHGFSRLIWFVDAILLLLGPGFDWQRMLQKAKKRGLAKAVMFTVTFLTQMRLIEPLPYTMRAFLAPAGLNGFERSALKKLVSNDRKGLCGELLLLCSIRGFLARVTFVIQVAFLKRERIPLTEPISPARYVWRIVRLAGAVVRSGCATLLRTRA